MNEMQAMEETLSSRPKIVEQNELLHEYTTLRLECFRLMYKAEIDLTTQYDTQIDSLFIRIEDVLGRLDAIN